MFVIMHVANKKLCLLIFLCIFSALEAQKKCATKETCGACIRELGCVWCNSPFSENSTSLRRCLTLQESKSPEFCDSENIINPSSSLVILQQLPIETSSSHGKQPVQISPQRIKISLRQGEQYNLTFKYAQAEDYPVDLYYIMDLSASMEKHRDKLSKLGTKLAETMNALTKQFRLGFGSFVDKVEMPFTSTVKEKLQSPCTLEGKRKPCAPPYSFKNHLSLTNRTELFTQQVENAIVSGNLDSPEGGLDALMQAMVCQEEIGWRPKARHLLVFSTDAGFHIAGDGKLAGIVYPHDGRCHMTNNMYTHSLLLDYPSIGHINQKAIEHNMNVIFAVEDKQTDIYTRLKNQIREASIGTLSGDSSNVVDLVKNVYDKIVDSVKITDNADSNIEIKYFSTCNSGNETETSECKNLKVGVQVDFRANIKLVSCPDTQNKTKIFEIKPGALNESLIVEIEMLCDCDCEKNTKWRASECSYGGSLECGICKCEPGKFGRNCECSGVNSTLGEVSDDCKLNKNSDEICSGFGTCKCNKCDCHKRNNEGELIYGKFCECNNYSCKRNKGLLCSGPDRGKCLCGKCECYGGWGGEYCECPGNNNTCINDGKLCSGRGDCKCGQCECHRVDGYLYFGTYCEECPTCDGKLCEELKHCVECKAYKTGIYNEEECYRYCNKKINIIDDIEEEKRENEKQCTAFDKDDCRFKYKYWYDANKELHIFAVKEKICNINILVLVLGIIGSIILAGLIALLLWKGVTSVHDSREYAKFENERRTARWNKGENPLFKSPTSTFANPTYAQ